MRQLYSFTKKEFMEMLRTGRGYILLLVFSVFGILNPLIAKLTPWLYDMLSDSLQNEGITIGNMTVTAMTSWEQYYKNLSMEYIVVVVMFCGVLVSEYQKGTLIHMLTKGLPRWKVMVSKEIAVITAWSICCWLCYGITYGYTAWFWDNGIAAHIGIAAFLAYLFGIWLCSLILTVSAYTNTYVAVLLTTGITFMGVYLLGMIPAAAKYVPVKLTEGLSLLSGAAEVRDYMAAAGVTILLVLLNWSAAIIGFNRKSI